MVVVIGIGSHAEVVKSILKSTDIQYVSFGDPCPLNPELQPYLGRLEDLDILTECIVAIGDNYIRKTIVEFILQKWPDVKFINAISTSAYISENVKIGVGNVICPGVIIQPGTIMGDHCIVNTNSSIDHHNDIRSYVHIAPNCALCGNVTLYEGCFIGVGSSIVPKVKVRPWFFYRAQSVVTKSNSPIPIHDMTIDKISMIDAINSGWISSRGEYLTKIREKLQSFLHVKHVLPLANGTCATHCLFLALKWKYPQITRIYCPNNVYVAAVNSALYNYQLSDIRVMRIDPQTLNIDVSEEYIHSLEPNSALLIVHNVGNIVNVPRLHRLRPDLIFVEDNCEGLFGKYEGVYSGTYSGTLCSSVSFFANKTVTSGEGGAVMTNDTDVYNFLAQTCNQGNSDVKYVHTVLGYNYRMTNIQAALLYDQLLRLESILERKRFIFDKYREILYQTSEPNTTPANWMVCVRIPGNSNYNQIETFFSRHGIDIRPFFYPLNVHYHLTDIQIDDPEQIGTLLQRECFMVPSYPDLTEKEIDYIISIVKQYKTTFKY